MTNNPTDNEIITKQSFEEKLTHFKKETKDFFATYQNKSGGEDCIEVCLIRYGYRTVLVAEDLINRLKAENEALISAQETLQKHIEKQIEKAKAEAIKEFAERLKKYSELYSYVTPRDIDNLVKEMVGDK